MDAERFAEIKSFTPKPTDMVDWEKLQKAVLEYLPELVAEIERLRAVLEFYADDKTYFNDWTEVDDGEDIYSDFGRKAREALQNGEG